MDKKPDECILKDCLASRLEQTYTKYMKTEEYLDLSSKEQQLYEKLKEELPEDRIKDLLAYSDIMAEIMLNENLYFYKSGFKDCKALLDIYMSF